MLLGKKMSWMWTTRSLLLIVIMGCLAQVATLAAAQEAAFSATADTLEGPAELPAGYHEFTVNNQGDAPYQVIVLRLADGTSRDELIAAVEAVDRAFAVDDPGPALNELMEIAQFYGEVYAEPGAADSFGMVLEPGTYLLVGKVEVEGGPEAALPNVYTDLTVTEEQNAVATNEDHVVQMVDFAFALPSNIQAGEQTWQVVNSGQQLHHMVMFKLHEGATMEDVMAWMETEEGPPPADEAGYVGILSPGVSNWVTMDLTPGEYFAICFMPDHLGDATGQPHFMLGMMQSFTVGNE